MVDTESVPLMVSVTVATSLVFVVMRVVVPSCWVVVLVISVVVGVSVVEVLVGMAVVDLEEGVGDSEVVVFWSDGVFTVVDVVVEDVVVDVVNGGIVVVVVIAVVLLPCLFSSTNSTISSTTLKADTVEKHSQNAAIKRRISRLFIGKRFLWGTEDIDCNETVIAGLEVNDLFAGGQMKE